MSHPCCVILGMTPPRTDRQALDEHHGTAGRIHIAIESAPTASLPKTLFIKVAPSSPIQQVIMSLFELGTREVLFYSAVASDAPLRTPECHGVELDSRRGRNMILLEDLSESAAFRDIREPASAAEAGAMIDAFADFHAAFWQSPRLDGDLAPLRSRSANAERIGNFFVKSVLGKLKGRSADVVPPTMQQQSRIMFEKRAEIDAFWATEPQTLCHGDTHLGNAFFVGDTPGFLDWQAVMVGPGIRDVSYFLIASMAASSLAAIERDLVDRYVARLADHGVEVDANRTWTLYRASASDFYVSAVVTARTSDRMQPAEISDVGVDRVVAAMDRLATFDILAQIISGKQI